MNNSVFHKEHINYKQEPIFFGTGSNVQDYANPKYPIFDKQDETMMGFFWRPQEVSLMNDRSDFKNFTTGEEFIFTANLQYQILLDSIQGRGPLLALLPVVTNPEVEASIITWGFMEKIHSKSYTYMIKNLYPDPSDVTDPILSIPEIIERAKAVGDYYDDYIRDMTKWLADPDSVDMYQLKRKLYLALCCINILEGIRFYVSFACNFAFGENRKMEGTAKIMGLIARDEAQHLAFTQNLIKKLQDGSEGEEWAKIAEECKAEVEQMFVDSAEQEKAWANYLFERGSMLGLNANVLHQYINHLTNKRMRALNLNQAFPPTRNPLSWLEHWLNSRGVQNAPQETEIDSYLVGSVDSDVEDKDFSDFAL